MRHREARRLANYSLTLGLIMGLGLVLLSLYSVNTGASAASTEGIQTERRGMGSPDAKVQMVVYFDFQCGHCATLHSEVEGQLIERYVKTGQVHLEVRPVGFLGEASQCAAEAALAAADQGKFFEFRDSLFRGVRTIGPAALTVDGLKTAANSLGLDMQVFESALISNSKKPELDAIMAEARSSGTRYVPTVLINGQSLVGAQPLQEYVRVIESELAK